MTPRQGPVNASVVFEKRRIHEAQLILQMLTWITGTFNEEVSGSARFDIDESRAGDQFLQEHITELSCSSVSTSLAQSKTHYAIVSLSPSLAVLLHNLRRVVAGI